MTTVAEAVTQLQGALATSAREHDLLQLIERLLTQLRALYRKQNSEFTAETITFLKGVASLEVTLREFIDALQDKTWIRTRDDAQELATRFQEIAERLTPHLVAKRAKKEVREIVEKGKALPFAAVAKVDADYRRRAVRLEQQAPTCRKCDENKKMVLRESQHGVFWGCSGFPHCFGRRWLTKKENALLTSAR